MKGQPSIKALSRMFLQGGIVFLIVLSAVIIGVAVKLRKRVFPIQTLAN